MHHKEIKEENDWKYRNKKGTAKGYVIDLHILFPTKFAT